jgi:hypothetical protein
MLKLNGIFGEQPSPREPCSTQKILLYMFIKLHR